MFDGNNRQMSALRMKMNLTQWGKMAATHSDSRQHGKCLSQHVHLQQHFHH